MVCAGGLSNSPEHYSQASQTCKFVQNSDKQGHVPSRSFEFRSEGEILIFVLAGMGRAIVKANVHLPCVVMLIEARWFRMESELRRLSMGVPRTQGLCQCRLEPPRMLTVAGSNVVSSAGTARPAEESSQCPQGRCLS